MELKIQSCHLLVNKTYRLKARDGASHCTWIIQNYRSVSQIATWDCIYIVASDGLCWGQESMCAWHFEENTVPGHLLVPIGNRSESTLVTVPSQNLDFVLLALELKLVFMMLHCLLVTRYIWYLYCFLSLSGKNTSNPWLIDTVNSLQ